MGQDALPEGWALATEWDTRAKGTKGTSFPSGEYQKVLRACCNRSIRAFKQDGGWVVHRQDVQEMLSRAAPQRKSLAKVPSAGTINNRLKSMEDLLEKIADAFGVQR